MQTSRSPDGGLREKVPAKQRWMGTGNARAQRLRYLFNGDRPEPIPAYRGWVEPPAKPADRQVTGICCSGGGIRSAAYNLGALQALQHKGELKRAHYLAAVSGGSYIAAAFAMVAKTSPPGEPKGDDSDPDLITKEGPFTHGSPEEQYLRNRSSYLAPDGMAKIFLAYRIVLGLLFNLFFISLPLFGATMLLSVLVYRSAFHTLVGTCGATCQNGVPLPLWAWVAPLAIFAPSFALGLLGLARRFNHSERLRAIEVWSTRLLVGAIAVAVVTIVLPELVSFVHVCDPCVKAKTGPASAAGAQTAAKQIVTTSTGVSTTTSVGVGLAGFIGLLTGVVSHLRNLVSTGVEIEGKFKSLPAKARTAIAYVAALLAGPALLLGMMVLTISLALRHADVASERVWLIGAGVATIVLFWCLYYWIDLTALSLHPFYKRRLCTAFALKRVTPQAGGRAPSTDEEAMKGIAVERDYDRHVKLSETGFDHDEWPTLLVCAAANVSDPGATPPGRRVTSFTFSPYTIGGPLVGAIETSKFETALDGERKRSRDLTLPATVAMSGAAVAPSMGKKTRWPLTFLMALANIRLGVWLPNPRWVAHEESAPWEGRIRSRPRPSYLLRELLGRNRIDAKYLFITDGGHYENLGLVELLRRGCTRIYCFDASGGSTFEELGDAVSLARSELGVDIDIDPRPLEPSSSADSNEREPAVAAQDVKEGRFTYADGTEGKLVYARNVMSPDAPWDVKAHHRADPAFPHDSTADQLYTDQKFESYRALGHLAGEHALALTKDW